MLFENYIKYLLKDLNKYGDVRTLKRSYYVLWRSIHSIKYSFRLAEPCEKRFWERNNIFGGCVYMTIIANSFMSVLIEAYHNFVMTALGCVKIFRVNVPARDQVLMRHSAITRFSFIWIVTQNNQKFLAELDTERKVFRKTLETLYGSEVNDVDFA